MQRYIGLFIVLFPKAVGMAAYVEPTIGGGQLGQGAAGMKHADISFERGVLSVVVDETVPVPMLRSLVPPDEFDPNGTWGMINGHAYNFQYGWNPSQFDAFPPDGTWIWIEQLDASPKLKVYQRPPASPEGLPVFGTESSELRWRWSGSMTHNLYAVPAPFSGEYFATYQVYIGDDLTGSPVAGFVPAEVTFYFTALLTGDYNNDGLVDIADYTVWRDNIGAAIALPNESASPGIVDIDDYTAWKTNFGTTSPAPVSLSDQPVPEPASVLLWVVAAVVVCSKRGSG